jgi:glucan 1,3-beta-glucosidase
MDHIRAVNLGGWLVLEHWMRPSLFKGIEGYDETQFCLQSKNVKKQLDDHRSTFIVESDFQWLKNHGINMVRLPYPFWLFGNIEPYYGCVEKLDEIMDWANKYELKVLLDLHTAPGCQNGFDNGGQLGVLTWHTKAENLELTLQILEKVALRYKDHPALWGMEILNEPHWTYEISFMEAFYEEAYTRLRKVLKPSTEIVFHDAFRNKAWKPFLSGKENVILDLHLYQGFEDKFKQAGIAKNVTYPLETYISLIDEISSYTRCIIGEWSLGLDPKNFEGSDAFNKHLGLRALGATQLLAFERAYGWVFWNYTIEEKDSGWNFKSCVEKGILPNDYR